MDYLYPTPGTLSFTPGTMSGNSQCFTLATIQDDDVEGVHNLVLTLVNATAGTLILGSSLVTITDDGIYGLHNSFGLGLLFVFSYSDVVGVSLADAASTVEGRPAEVIISLVLISGKLMCGDVIVHLSTMDMTASEQINEKLKFYTKNVFYIQ